jgi:hypothetical protein
VGISGNESRQEVTTVEKNIRVRRPSALLAVCAPVSEPSWHAPALTAHVPVGYGAVVTAAATGATSLLLPPQVQVKGTSVFGAKYDVIDMDPVGGVRGRPPRGRPV